MASNALSLLTYMHILFCRHAIISDPVFLMYIYVCIDMHIFHVYLIYMMYGMSCI